MLFESSTLLERQAGPSSPSPAELANVEHSIDLIDAALRLALTNSSSKTLSGVKITEKSSFKHLDSICPAMWGLGHLEVALATIINTGINTDHVIYRLLLQEQFSCPLLAMPCPTQSRNVRIR